MGNGTRQPLEGDRTGSGWQRAYLTPMNKKRSPAPRLGVVGLELREDAFGYGDLGFTASGQEASVDLYRDVALTEHGEAQ